jgi:hypothetical protein
MNQHGGVRLKNKGKRGFEPVLDMLLSKGVEGRESNGRGKS